MNSVQSNSSNRDSFKFTTKQNISYLNRLITSRAFQGFFKTIEQLPFLPQKQNRKVRSLSRHYQIRARRTEEAKKVFGRHLVHYGANVERASTIGRKPKIEKLNKVTKKARRAAREIQLENPKIMKASKKKSEGICLAASMHCISRIIEQNKTLDNHSAFIEATSIYENGIPEKIAIAQTFSRHLKPSNLDDYRNKLRLSDSFFTKYFKFHLGSHHSCYKSDFSEKFLKNAKPGTYLMNIMDDKWKAGHSLVIVKNTDGSAYIYDPNFGSAIVPKKHVEQTLKRIFNHPYYKGLDNLVYARVQAN